jgi:hypothetical protein
MDTGELGVFPRTRVLMRAAKVRIHRLSGSTI